MKIKSLAALCKKNHSIFLYDEPEENGAVNQWIGDGRAFYPITNIPYLSLENICTIFELDPKQKGEFNLQHSRLPEDINFADTDRSEEMLDRDPISIFYQGKYLKIFGSRNGILFTESKYLEPLLEISGYLELFERRTEAGKSYIAAKAGFLLVAIIMPNDIVSESFVDMLDLLTRKCKSQLMIEKSSKPVDDPRQQLSLMFGGKQIDISTGEVMEDTEGTH